MEEIKKIFKEIKSKTLIAMASMGISIPAFAGSPLPISNQEEAQQGQGILQLFQGILDNEVILFIVIFFAIVICIACLGGAYSSYRRFEEDEKLGKLIVSWIVCAVFFVLSGAFLYIMYQIKTFNG